MGLGGTLDFFSDLLGRSHKHSDNKQMQTVELKVRMDCEGCELKVRKTLSSIKCLPTPFHLLFLQWHILSLKFPFKWVKTVAINMKQQKVTVTGYVDQKKVLKKAKATGKKTEIWPYVPYSEVNHPYSVGAYDKKAPPGYVRKVESAAVSTQEIRREDQITNMFSDENPNSCSIM